MEHLVTITASFIALSVPLKPCQGNRTPAQDRAIIYAASRYLCEERRSPLQRPRQRAAINDRTIGWAGISTGTLQQFGLKTSNAAQALYDGAKRNQHVGVSIRGLPLPQCAMFVGSKDATRICQDLRDERRSKYSSVIWFTLPGYSGDGNNSLLQFQVDDGSRHGASRGYMYLVKVNGRWHTSWCHLAQRG